MRFMCVALCVWFMLAHTINAHKGIRPQLATLKEDISDVEQGQSDIREVIQALSDNIANLTETSEPETKVDGTPDDTHVGISSKMDVVKRRKWLARLNVLEKDILQLDNYLGAEKDTDTFLSRLDGDLMDGFKGKMKETNELVKTMKGTVQKSLVDVNSTLHEVEVLAKSRNVEVAGVMYYGGIGSACAVEKSECEVSESECRSGMCQCVPGLSYDGLFQECVGSCPAYGNTYQRVGKHILRGYNNYTVENTTLDECKTLCQEARDFECRSIDYFPRWQTCFLSEFVKTDAPEEEWEYNGVGDHYQRDCLI